MLGPTKWRLLTIVAGILLAQAIESPSNEYSNSLAGSSKNSVSSSKSSSIDSSQHQATASFVNAQLGIQLEEFGLGGVEPDVAAVPVVSRQTANNLLPPYQTFSIVDNIRYVDSKTRNSRGMPETFGSFRIVSNVSSFTDDVSDVVRRRFDSSSEMPYNYNKNDNNTLNSLQQQQQQQHNYYIPIKTVNRDKNININNHNNNILPTTNPFIQQINDDIIGQIQSESNYNNNNNKSSSLITTTSQSHTTSDESDVAISDYDYVEPSARRSGFRFPSDARQSKFVPQGYSEDNPSFAESLSNQHRPFLEEQFLAQDSLKDHNEPARLAELLGRNRFNPGLLGVDDPIVAEASSNHQIRMLPVIPGTTIPDSLAQESDLNANVQRQSLRTYPTIYYQNDFRPSRHYFPPKVYTETNEFPQVLAAATNNKNKFPVGVSSWKSRTPRVIFPIPDGISSASGIGTSPYSNDNIVFRWVFIGVN